MLTATLPEEFAHTEQSMTTRNTIPSPTNQETVGADTDDRSKVRVVSYGGSHQRNSLHIDIHGLDNKELDLMQGAMHGHHWVTCKDGRIENVPTYKQLPGPTEDEMMLPFWRRPQEGVETQLSLFSLEPMPDWCSPCITIQHLCGYNYTAERYRHEAENLTRWGFMCLRSQRNLSGEYWEQWYLPLWAAQEELKQAIDAQDPYFLQRNTVEEFLRDTFTIPKEKPYVEKTDKNRLKREIDVAVRFLCRNAQFGTLDVSIQRAAMTVD